MLLLDIKDNRVLRMIKRKGSVTLITLCDHHLTILLPMSIVTQYGDLSTHVVTRHHAATSQNMRTHRGGRCFTMRARNNHTLPSVQDRCQALCSSDTGNTLSSGLSAGNILFTNSR